MPWYTAVECNRPPLYEAWVTFISEMTNNYLIWNILIYSVTRYHEERKFLLRVFTRLKKERQISTESAGTFRFYGNHQQDNFVFTDMSNQSHKYIFFACTLLSFFQDLANFIGWVLGAYGQERAIRNSSSRISFRVSKRTKNQRTLCGQTPRAKSPVPHPQRNSPFLGTERYSWQTKSCEKPQKTKRYIIPLH